MHRKREIDMQFDSKVPTGANLDDNYMQCDRTRMIVIVFR